MDSIPHPPGGCFNGENHLFAVRVYYEDTDLSGVVYHANYLRWFERARSDMLRLLKVDQNAAMEADIGTYVVSDVQLSYLQPARLDDDIIIHTRCVKMGAASCVMEQRAIRADEPLVEGRLRVGFVDMKGRPRRQPAEWRAAFAPIIAKEKTA